MKWEINTKAGYAICPKEKMWESCITNEAQCVVRDDRSNRQEFLCLKLVFATRCTFSFEVIYSLSSVYSYTKIKDNKSNQHDILK